MEFSTCLIAAHVFATALCAIILLFLLVRYLLRIWKDVASTKPVWHNKYPSFEELHSFFDRGDIMVSAILVASALQLTHAGLSKTIKAHSTYKSDFWRRAIRTMTFIFIMIRSNSSEREQVIAWLQNLHRSIPLFVFETNLVVFTTFAYGLVKTHELLGNTTSEQADAIVNGVMSIADKLNPEDLGRKVPRTMKEVEEHLQQELSLDADELLHIHAEFSKYGSIRKEMKKQGVGQFLKRPSLSIQLLLFKSFVWTLSGNVLAQHDSGQGTIGKPFWGCMRRIHWFFSSFHYSMCPQALTFDGTLKLLLSGNPRMNSVARELYCEIFGSKMSPASTYSSETSLRRFADMEAHLPQMAIDHRPMPAVGGFYEEAAELLKCSYYRGQLSHFDDRPQHLGVIMDGNRRYSRHKGYSSVLAGHEVGANKLIQVMAWAFSSGVQNLTVWALSDDNLKRGPQELDPLYSMMAEYIREILVGDAPFSIPDVRFRVVGDRSILPDYLNEIITKAEAATAQNTRFNLQMAIGYGGRSEIVRATKLAIENLMTEGLLSLEKAITGLTEKDISSQIYSARLGLPPIDAILRTSGENRLSGFALWESHHAEFVIVEENWPALRQSTFLKSLLDLSKRKRRFGA